MAEVPPGPRLTFIRGSDQTLELVSANDEGGDQRTIVGGGAKAMPLPYPFSPPSWSADGSRLVFAALTRRKSLVLDLYAAAADGSAVTKLPGTREAVYPVLSPDGGVLAFARQKERRAFRAHRGRVTVFRSLSTWLLDIETGAVRRITPWRNGLFEIPASFSPDGSTLGISKSQESATGVPRFSAIARRLDGSGATVIADDATEPVFSPDGGRVALIATEGRARIKSTEGDVTFTRTDLAVANADGSGLRRLTHTSAVESGPSWDPSGDRLAYTREHIAPSEASLLGMGAALMEINPDGSCQTRVLSDPKQILFGATWQPGPGRGAGPIAC